jgi:hypothetical protein
MRKSGCRSAVSAEKSELFALNRRCGLADVRAIRVDRFTGVVSHSR